MATTIKKPRWVPSWLFDFIVHLVDQLLRSVLERIEDIEARVNDLEDRAGL